MQMKPNEFLTKTEDGRVWRVEVFGPGENEFVRVGVWIVDAKEAKFNSEKS